MPPKVLVLGDDTRSFLAVVRSLGRRGIEVHAAPADFTAPALKSRYIAKLHYLPHWSADPAAWLDAMTALLSAETFALLIPCNETTLLPLQHNRAALEPLARLAIPDDRSIEVLFDKQNTRDLAASLGIPVAPGQVARADDQAAALVQQFGLPLVLKPRRSYALDTLAARGKVQVLDTEAAVQALLPLDHPEHSIYEGFFPGQGVGVSILASGGCVLQAFEHHRIRENASGSHYRVSAPLTPALEAACAAIAGALSYTGVAMFEFRVNAAGGWILLEVNARPWGSLPLPLSLGIDFPYRWYRLLVDGVETPAVAYEAGIFGRNLIPDSRNTAAELAALLARPIRFASLAARRLSELARGLNGRDRHDLAVPDDRAPAFREARDLFQSILARLITKVPGRAARARARAVAALGAIDFTKPANIVVVCQGNICRSPLAAVILARDLAGHPGLVVAGAGMLPRPGRPTPAYGVAAAAIMGIDLSTHRSRPLTRAQAEGATVLFIFDDINLVAIQQRFPALRTPVIKLGALSDAGPIDIQDPIDGEPALYATVYAQIEAACAAAVRRIGRA